MKLPYTHCIKELPQLLEKTCVATLVISIALCLIGCDGAPEGMAKVSGTVTWNGEPIESGYISFVPDKSKAPQAGKIENGKFSFNAYTGKNIIRIESSKKMGYVESMKQHSYKLFIPPKYNTDSELSEDVSSDRQNDFQFDLKGKEL